jgi:hypothetical protein
LNQLGGILFAGDGFDEEAVLDGEIGSAGDEEFGFIEFCFLLVRAVVDVVREVVAVLAGVFSHQENLHLYHKGRVSE